MKSDASNELGIELHGIEKEINNFDYESGTIDECTSSLQALQDRRNVVSHRLMVARRVEATAQIADARANMAKLKEEKAEVARAYEQITAEVTTALSQYYGDRAKSMAESTGQVMEALDRLDALRSRIDKAQQCIGELERTKSMLFDKGKGMVSQFLYDK